MKKRKRMQMALLMLMLFSLLAAGGAQVFASPPQDRKPPEPIEIELEFGEKYEVSIGRSGVHIPSSSMKGTLRFEKEPNERNYEGAWHVFTQAWAIVNGYDEDEKEFERVFGNAQIFFDLDVTQRRYYDDPDRNMSIWYYDTFEIGWVKCPTALVRVGPAAPHGRLVCPMTYFGRYGVAWTLPTLEMKLDKVE